MNSSTAFNFQHARSMRKGFWPSSFASDTARMRNDDVEAPRYKKRKQREQTVIKAPAREQRNDVATRTSLEWKFAWIMHFFAAPSLHSVTVPTDAQHLSISSDRYFIRMRAECVVSFYLFSSNEKSSLCLSSIFFSLFIYRNFIKWKLKRYASIFAYEDFFRSIRKIDLFE